MNHATLEGLRSELEKIALRAGAKIIQRLMQRGGAGALEQANRLAKTPGVLKPSAMGSQIKHLGRGSEGVADLVAHPQHGVSVRKLYDPTSTVASPRMVGRKMQLAKQVDSPVMAQTHGFARTGSGGRASFHEYVPGGKPTAEAESAIKSQLQSAGAKKGYQLEDIRAGNIRGGKAIDVLPFHGGEVATSKGGRMGLTLQGSAVHGRHMTKAEGRVPEGLSTKNLYKTMRGGSKGQSLQQLTTAPQRSAISLPKSQPLAASAPPSPARTSMVGKPTGPTATAAPTKMLKPTKPPTPPGMSFAMPG
jgi:hypothetical protein